MNGFLFDENIPRQITLSASLPISHATDLGKSISDSDIWSYAKNHCWWLSQKTLIFQTVSSFRPLRLGLFIYDLEI